MEDTPEGYLNTAPGYITLFMMHYIYNALNNEDRG